jgi:CubicO group peptidase (beta-lactamase class C family)
VTGAESAGRAFAVYEQAALLAANLVLLFLARVVGEVEQKIELGPRLTLRRRHGHGIRPYAYGHTGYTGTLLWIDPLSDTFLITLTSRLHPGGHGDARLLRQKVAQAVPAATNRDFAHVIDMMAEQRCASSEALASGW